MSSGVPERKQLSRATSPLPPPLLEQGSANPIEVVGDPCVEACVRLQALNGAVCLLQLGDPRGPAALDAKRQVQTRLIGKCSLWEMESTSVIQQKGLPKDYE